MAVYIDPLFARADRAIANAIATRAEVQAGLIAAGQRRPYWTYQRTSNPPFPDPADREVLEPWWSVARTLGFTNKILPANDQNAV